MKRGYGDTLFAALVFNGSAQNDELRMIKQVC